MCEIHHEVIIGAPVENVYHAITSQEGLSAWWTPDTAATAEPGSIARFGFGPDYFKEMKIVELNPFQQVRWVCRQGADEWIGTDICFDLQSGDKATLLSAHPEVKGQLEQQVHNNTTLLVFRHSNWKDYSPMFAECNYTWAQFLRSLKLYSETGTGRLWPQQHHGT